MHSTFFIERHNRTHAKTVIRKARKRERLLHDQSLKVSQRLAFTLNANYNGDAQAKSIHSITRWKISTRDRAKSHTPKQGAMMRHRLK